MKSALFSLSILLALAAAACGTEPHSPTLKIAGIPDQNSSTVARRYEILTSYLSQELDVNVEFVPTVDYSATVVGFKQGEIQLTWFGGLTGVQARKAVPGSKAIAQRQRKDNIAKPDGGRNPTGFGHRHAKRPGPRRAQTQRRVVPPCGRNSPAVRSGAAYQRPPQ